MKKKIIIIAVFVLIIDIITKILVDNSFNLNESNVIISNFFYLTKIYNDGASWSILAGHPLIIIIISIVILIMLLIYQSRFKHNLRNIIAFGFLYGGIMGNLLDRVLYTYVIDFLDFKIFGYDFPVFNLADIFIVMGIFLLLIAVFKKEDEYGNNSGH